METSQDTFEQNKKALNAPNSKALTQETNDYLNQIKQFENDRVDMAKQSAKTAWKVATGAGTLAGLALIALAVTMPLKEVEPYLLSVDSKTGFTTILKPLADAQKTTYGEVLDRFWVNRYIIERNSYIWESVQGSFDVIKLMSASNVFARYKSYIMGDKSPVATFKDRKQIKVSIKNITFLPASDDEQIIAQVQFSRDVLSRDGQPASGYKTTHWTATLTFDYLAPVKSEIARRQNPLGFRVTSYREDKVVE
ncbi:conjugal transfer protein TraG [Vibrio parahaemolyticus]|nr:type IV secretion system protein [Vibrio parahaemolyticus]EGQ8549111.1 conjugal transfer protein TraG [Vibrio parahaemolyticus]EGQ9131417.1 conjugal transfer protein TraG [Vibrio parahaemolyticus]ELA6925042.1 type IV secretion system protein [Vibrio parahaemolyticus]